MYPGPVARFVVFKVVCAVKAALKAARQAWEALAASLIREEEVSRFVRHELHGFGSDDEGRLRGVGRPLKARVEAAELALAFHGPRRVLRGEA